MVKMKTLVQAMIEVFEEEERPLHYRELTRLVLEKVEITSKIPEKTIAGRLSENPIFTRVSEGIYVLSAWKGYQEARFAKDIAYEILSTCGKPIDVSKLGELILEERDFKGKPSYVGYHAVLRDPRFHYQPSMKTVGLVEWEMD